MAALSIAAIGCGDDESAGGGDAATAVTIQDFAFMPRDITVQAGAEITWTNEDSADHTATADDPEVFDTGTIAEDGEGTATLDAPGTFQYICTIHPSMKGSITVE